ncbi:hypothetical protein EDD85DRAFT_954618 [Armillaria nabsnona]|nr:hypothetical protein EDD85DRAFT_954618 [Armillaria nabsnona]
MHSLCTYLARTVSSARRNLVDAPIHVASATNALRLSSYDPSHRPGSLKPWLRTSATHMKEHLNAAFARFIMVPP